MGDVEDPVKLMPMISSQSCVTSSASAVKAFRRLMPALFTRIEVWPIFSAIWTANWRHWLRFVTSSLRFSFAALVEDLLHDRAAPSRLSRYDGRLLLHSLLHAFRYRMHPL